VQSRAEQSRAEQSRAEQSRAEQSRAEQSRAEQRRIEQGRGDQRIAVYSCSVEWSVLLFNFSLFISFIFRYRSD